MAKYNLKHGNSSGGNRTPEYNAWNAMISRCTNKHSRCFHRYGGRGIKVCSRWLGPDGFRNFLADMGKRPAVGWSIDRKNNNKDYDPSNCQWAPPVVQARNRGNSVFLTLGNTKKHVIEWAEELGIPASILRWRHSMGWSNEKVLTTGYKSRSHKGRTRVH